ncbi:MAG: CCA tRNA nucleotidyltransferase [Alphaproteobacteria bacterium]
MRELVPFKKVLAILDHKELNPLYKLFSSHNVEIHLVGGCVRDAFLGKKTDDIDIAVPISPKITLDILKKASIKIAHIKLEYGTITAIMPPFKIEITSLRKDIKTDGRHAEVIFCTSLKEDAKRRDFTINAIYVNPITKELFDPFSGLKDLKEGIIKFIGSCKKRICEDYLRLLRYYRFLAFYGLSTSPPLENPSFYKEGFLRLSIERIRKELLTLLSAKDPLLAISSMHKDKVFDWIFPKGYTIEALKRLIAFEKYFSFSVLVQRRFTVLLVNDIKKENWPRFLFHYKDTIKETLATNDPLHVLYIWGYDICLDWMLINQSICKEYNEESALLKIKLHLKWLKTTKKPFFPLKGIDLIQKGFKEGPKIGKTLSEIEKWWVKHEFKPSKNECLKFLTKLYRI